MGSLCLLFSRKLQATVKGAGVDNWQGSGWQGLKNVCSILKQIWFPRHIHTKKGGVDTTGKTLSLCITNLGLAWITSFFSCYCVYNFFFFFECSCFGLPSGSVVKNPPAMQETQDMWVRSLGWEDPLEEGMAIYPSIFAWRIPWTEELGGLLSRGLQRLRHDWSNRARIDAFPRCACFCRRAKRLSSVYTHVPSLLDFFPI